MTINRLPLSTERLTFHLVTIEPKIDFDTAEQRKTQDGTPQWKATVLVTSDELKAETAEVTVTASTMPSIPAMSPVQLEAPMASLWQQGTRAGLAISAKSIRPANGARPTVPAPNGTPEPAKAAT
jgi:hypothetical protein